MIDDHARAHKPRVYHPESGILRARMPAHIEEPFWPQMRPPSLAGKDARRYALGVLFLFCIIGRSLALTYEEAAQTPLNVEELARSTAVGPTPADWAKAGDSWLGGDSNQATGAKLEVVDFYYSAGSGAEGENRIFASLAKAVALKGKAPAILVFHGGGGHGDKYLAIALARANPGFAVLAMDYNGQFRPSQGKVTQWKSVVQNNETTRGNFDPGSNLIPNAAIAARRGIDLLVTMEDIDADRIGLVGISYGGWVALRAAADDTRVKFVATTVSSGGVSGTGSYTARTERTLSPEEIEAWRREVEPLSVADKITCPVFLNLSTNDRFFWLSGARQFFAKLPNPLNRWLLTPNSDHNAGGIKLANPIAAWIRAVLEAKPLPSVEVPSLDGGKLRWAVSHEITACTAWWSPGSTVSPARYWIPVEGRKSADAGWEANLPENFVGVSGEAFVTAEGPEFLFSSSLLDIPGTDPRVSARHILWENSIWDSSRGADAWRAPVIGGNVKTTIKAADDGTVTFAPGGGKGIAAITNSVVVASENAKAAKGLSISLEAEGASQPIKVALMRDGNSLDEKRFEASVDIVGVGKPFVIPWWDFRSTKGGDNELFPFDTLEISTTDPDLKSLRVGAITLENTNSGF